MLGFISVPSWIDYLAWSVDQIALLKRLVWNMTWLISGWMHLECKREYKYFEPRGLYCFTCIWFFFWASGSVIILRVSQFVLREYHIVSWEILNVSFSLSLYVVFSLHALWGKPFLECLVTHCNLVAVYSIMYFDLSFDCKPREFMYVVWVGNVTKRLDFVCKHCWGINLYKFYAILQHLIITV